ncbi:hypothetical protein EYF80_053772 [Liparis tanakae]|uniref:Uncharacterized protein n=1 Tax=Liparis tanakae TaxID=230148 RepID=A0A4Z2F5D0_9TELE|nr:hypothetical protein EYF80_053772 [Liparis tanakae]
MFLDHNSFLLTNNNHCRRGIRRTRGLEDQRTRGLKDQRTKGPEDQEDQRTRGLKDQRTKGPEDQEDQRTTRGLHRAARETRV